MVKGKVFIVDTRDQRARGIWKSPIDLAWPEDCALPWEKQEKRGVGGTEN